MDEKAVDLGRWGCELELDKDRQVGAGDPARLARSVAGGADLRVVTSFRHNEHVEIGSEDDQVVNEVSDFPVTYLVDEHWVAGAMTLRQPVFLREDFGPPSMSFFLYNQDGTQAVARPYLTSRRAEETFTAGQDVGGDRLLRLGEFDLGTNAPSSSFVYRFDHYRFVTRRRWREVASTSADGQVLSGCIDELGSAVRSGQGIKVAVSNFSPSPESDVSSFQTMVRLTSSYSYTRDRRLIGLTMPLVRVRPSMPMGYSSGGWDFGWALVSTNGLVNYRRCDPQTLRFTDTRSHHSIRWFTSES